MNLKLNDYSISNFEPDYENAPFAYIQYRHTKDDFIGSESGYTTCCGEYVSRSQYGADEECPCCNKVINWSEYDKEEFDKQAKEQFKQYLVTEKEKNVEEFNSILSGIQAPGLDGVIELLHQFEKLFNIPVSQNVETQYIYDNKVINAEELILRGDMDTNHYVRLSVSNDKVVAGSYYIDYIKELDMDGHCEFSSYTVKDKSIGFTLNCKNIPFLNSVFEEVNSPDKIQERTEQYNERVRQQNIATEIKKLSEQSHIAFSKQDLSTAFQLEKQSFMLLDDSKEPESLDVLKSIVDKECHIFSRSSAWKNLPILITQTDSGTVLNKAVCVDYSCELNMVLEYATDNSPVKIDYDNKKEYKLEPVISTSAKLLPENVENLVIAKSIYTDDFIQQCIDGVIEETPPLYDVEIKQWCPFMDEDAEGNDVLVFYDCPFLAETCLIADTDRVEEEYEWYKEEVLDEMENEFYPNSNRVKSESDFFDDLISDAIAAGNIVVTARIDENNNVVLETKGVENPDGLWEFGQRIVSETEQDLIYEVFNQFDRLDDYETLYGNAEEVEEKVEEPDEYDF